MWIDKGEIMKCSSLGSADAEVEAPHPAASTTTLSPIDVLLGAAIFDLNGLPKEYFMARDRDDARWVQTVFQALGLQSLLASSLQLEGFRHVIIHGSDGHAIVVRQKNCYAALLLSSQGKTVPESLIHWSYEFEPGILKNHPRFQSF